MCQLRVTPPGPSFQSSARYAHFDDNPNRFPLRGIRVSRTARPRPPGLLAPTTADDRICIDGAAGPASASATQEASALPASDDRVAAKGIAGLAIDGAMATYRWSDASDRTVRDVTARR
jgi:hypothetical protein